MSLTSKSFTAADLDTDNYQTISASNHGDRASPQSIRFFATNTTASTTATIELALVDETAGVVIARFIGSANATARRGATGGAAGTYICDVVWDETSTSKMDLLGARKDVQWKLGCIVISAGTLVVYWHESELI